MSRAPRSPTSPRGRAIKITSMVGGAVMGMLASVVGSALMLLSVLAFSQLVSPEPLMCSPHIQEPRPDDETAKLERREPPFDQAPGSMPYNWLRSENGSVDRARSIWHECCEKRLLVNPGLEGTVVAQFQIRPDGTVLSATARGMHPEVDDCVAEVIKKLKFPRTDQREPVLVRHSITFRPAGYTMGGLGTEMGSNVCCGTMPRRSVRRPEVLIGPPKMEGDLDRNIIRRHVRQHLARIEHCYERQLLVSPGLAGTVLAQFQINPQGVVLSATARGMHAEVADCVAEVVKGIKFPRTRTGQSAPVQVQYPFTFRPAGG